MWWWILVPIAAVYVNGWMVEKVGEPRPYRGNLAYAGLWLGAFAVTSIGRAPSPIRAFCLFVFAFAWFTAPTVRSGDIESVLSVNPFHKAWIKWAMLATAVILYVW